MLKVIDANTTELIAEAVVECEPLQGEYVHDLLIKISAIPNMLWANAQCYGIHDIERWKIGSGVTLRSFLGDIKCLRGEIISVNGTLDDVRVSFYLILDGGTTFDLRIDVDDEDSLRETAEKILKFIS